MRENEYTKVGASTAVSSINTTTSTRNTVGWYSITRDWRATMYKEVPGLFRWCINIALLCTEKGEARDLVLVFLGLDSRGSSSRAYGKCCKICKVLCYRIS